MKILSKYITKNHKHIVYEIFGIKFKVLNPHIELYKRVDGINKMLDYLADIETLPKAKGKLRDVQLQITEMLKLVDSIFQKHNLKYWLDFGTLIGAARHNGFIPWDDDVDICMVRDDYEKAIKILHEELNFTPYFCRERYEYGNNFQARIRKRSENIGIDIFPVDEFPSDKKYPNIDKIVNVKFERARKRLDTVWNKREYSSEEVQKAKQEIKRYIQEEGLADYNKKIEKPLLVYGIDYHHKWKYKIFEYEMIFPLKKHSFEGLSLPVPNKFETHLTNIYGDWHKLPKNFDNIDWFWK